MRPEAARPRYSRNYKFWVSWFSEPVYSADVLLFWNVDAKGMNAYFAEAFPNHKVSVPVPDPWVGWSLELSDKNIELYLICLRSFDWSPMAISTLTHECLHTSLSMLRSRGMRLNKHTEEAYCYLHDSLVRRCLEEIKKAKR
jgi:hypothetical protein